VDLNVQAGFEAADGVVIDPGAVVGYSFDGWSAPAKLGANCRVRIGTVIYANTVMGARSATGTYALVREFTNMGEDCLVGSTAVIEGHVRMGDSVVLQSGVFVPTETVIGNRVFVGPCAVLTNDRYPLRRRSTYRAEGPVLEDDVTVGANATLLPGVHIGQGAMVAAGAVVTKDVPSWSMAIGCPARIRDLPDDLCLPNQPRRRA
jgi:acetyltransferase-like isoleucine patch superfamily enzyme